MKEQASLESPSRRAARRASGSWVHRETAKRVSVDETKLVLEAGDGRVVVLAIRTGEGASEELIFNAITYAARKGLNRMPEPHAALQRFSAPTRTWFEAAFAEPTPAQDGAWAVIVEYEESGYVKDDDAAKINYDDLLKKMQAGIAENNKTPRDFLIFVLRKKSFSFDLHR